MATEKAGLQHLQETSHECGKNRGAHPLTVSQGWLLALSVFGPWRERVLPASSLAIIITRSVPVPTWMAVAVPSLKKLPWSMARPLMISIAGKDALQLMKRALERENKPALFQETPWSREPQKLAPLTLRSQFVPGRAWMPMRLAPPPELARLRLEM